MTAREYAEALRLLADWYERHADRPWLTVPSWPENVGFCATTEELAEAGRALGRCREDVDDSYYKLRGHIGARPVYVFAPREQVCHRRVVGHRDIPEQVTPARREEIVEWECEPLLDHARGGGWVMEAKREQEAGEAILEMQAERGGAR